MSRQGGLVCWDERMDDVHVSLRLESCSRKVLKKQYLFHDSVRFQLVLFFSKSKRLYEIHVT